MVPSLLLLLCVQCVPVATGLWSGPAVRVAFRGEVPSVLIDGVPTAPQFFMLGNPPSINNFSTWEAEISAAREAGVRIFFVCDGGDEQADAVGCSMGMGGAPSASKAAGDDCAVM